MENKFITPETLRCSGYSQFNSPGKSPEIYVTSFQKRVLSDDDGQTLYFINYDVFQVPENYHRPDKFHYVVELDVQFVSRHNDDVSVNISLNTQGMTFDDVDKIVRRLWDAEGAPYSY